MVIDVETGGFNERTDALLELAAVPISMDPSGDLICDAPFFEHIKPFPKANLEPSSLAFLGLDPFHPFRFAVEEKEALEGLFARVRESLKIQRCHRAVLVGHNAHFDLNFLNAAIKRTQLSNSPFHSFSVFDTATLAGLIYGQTVLSKALQAAGMAYESSRAHSALYDAQTTAELFCKMVNRWSALGGWPLKDDEQSH